MRQFEVMLGERLLPADWIYNIYLSTWAFTSFDGDFRVFSVSEDCPPSAVVRHIRRLRPKIISAFPSFVSRMMALPQDLSRFGVRCICTNSEGSTRQERNAFAEAFGVPVFDEYSTEELCGVVASECVKERYHIVEDRVVVEVANTGLDRVGDIIATDLANFYMPIIRYSQGDLIGLADESTTCDCGNSFRYFDKLLGRGDQALNSPAIGRVPGDRLMNLLDRTLVSYESGVAAFRVVQVQHDAVDVLIVLRSGVFVIDANIWDTLTDGLRELFEYRITITLRYLNALPDLGSHKRRSIVNEVHLQ
jgi:phenylacetate-CoA ligase